MDGELRSRVHARKEDVAIEGGRKEEMINSEAVWGIR